MPQLRRDAVRVVVPATSANLGPAFDCAGLALDLEDELVAMVSDDPGVLIEITGEGSDSLPTDASHLVARSMALGFDAMGIRPDGFVLRCTNRIPHGRGMGSSAAAIIGGLVLARAMVVDGPLSDDDIMALALSMESHPDNITAALYGGLTFAWTTPEEGARHIRLDVHPAVRPVIAVPGESVATSKARAVLPTRVPLADASHNIARSALLVHALTADPSMLLEATSDRIHQEPRRAMYPASLALVEALRERGVPAAISGAGPSVIALAGPDLVEMVLEVVDPRWRAIPVSVASQGAREVPIHP